MKKSKRPKLVLATNNKHKVVEIKSILKSAGLKIDLVTMDAYPHLKPVVENKPTIEGNARKKASEIAKKTGEFALADDTGLFVHALKGKPGVYSARFAGVGCSYLDNNSKILRLMKKVAEPKRKAVFRCIAALSSPTGRTLLAEGRIDGKVAAEIQGKTGFGYDPIFYVPKYKKTFAEMGSALKNKISHRSKAFHQVPKLWRKITRPS